jgi:hypothetical protein
VGKRQTIPGNAGGVALVPTFAPDPYGTHQFAGALDAATLGLSTGITPVIDARGGPRWHGWTDGLQNFRGAGNIGTGGRAVLPTTTRLDQTAGSAVSSPVQQIFEQRMAARRFS